MSDLLPSVPAPPGRAWYLRTIGVATATLVVISVLSFAARGLGHRLEPWIPPTLFLMSIGIVQPKVPGTLGRPLPQRLAFSLVIGLIGGVFMWAIHSLTQ